MSKPPGTYPNRIKEFRLRRPRVERITQQVLADALRVTQPTFHALEQGQTELTPRKAQILAPFLHCEPWELSPALEQFVKGCKELKSGKRRPKR